VGILYRSSSFPLLLQLHLNTIDKSFIFIYIYVYICIICVCIYGYIYLFNVSHLSIIITNTWDNQLTKRKDLLWLTVLEASSRINWPCCSWVCSKAVHHGRDSWQSKAITLWLGSQRKKKRLDSNYPLQRHTSSDLKACHWASPLKDSTTSQNTKLGTNPLTHFLSEPSLLKWTQWNHMRILRYCGFCRLQTQCLQVFVQVVMDLCI
jgi:hypothetical protein